MERIEGWENIKASDDNRLAPGGYVAKIMSVENVPNKQYLKIELDIAEGDDKGYYADLAQRAGFWGLTLYRSYKPKAAGMFKSFIDHVEQSNDGYTWNWDENTLEDMRVGIVLREEEYIGNDGSVKTRLVVSSTKSADDIRNGKFKVPKKKELPAEEKKKPESFEEIDTDVPF